MVENKVDNIVVVGGGTAGWLTALTANKIFPNSKVTVIASEEIGILGAGEGTIPIFIEFMDWLGISLSEFVSNSNAVIKNANKFTNWCGDGKSYYHGFGAFGNEVSGHLEDSYDFNINHNNLYYHASVVNEIDSGTLDLPAMLSEAGKVPHIFANPNQKPESASSLTEFYNVAPFAMSFDAVMVSKFLKSVALKRGVIFIDGRITKCIESDNGNISSLLLEDGTEEQCDFVFDCSGFYKLITGRHYKSKWVDLSGMLTVNSAQPFFIEIEDSIPPFMESIAMDYGWIWKTPLQHRYGCGYVYDSNHTDKESVKKEIIDWLGYEPKFMKHFSFRPGYCEEPWKNNSISLGVSSGFLEPMEATSIWTTVYFLQILASDPAQLIINDQKSKDVFNKRFTNWFIEQSEFIYLHYMGGRTDNEFWKFYQNKDNIPNGVNKILDRWTHSLPRYLDHQTEFGDVAFGYSSWFEVCYGLNLINKDRVKQSFELNNWQSYIQRFNEKKNKQNQIVDLSISHNNMLKALGGLRNKKETY